MNIKIEISAASRWTFTRAFSRRLHKLFVLCRRTQMKARLFRLRPHDICIGSMIRTSAKSNWSPPGPIYKYSPSNEQCIYNRFDIFCKKCLRKPNIPNQPPKIPAQCFLQPGFGTVGIINSSHNYNALMLRTHLCC